MGFSKSSAKVKFIALQAYLKKQEKHQINDLTLHLEQLEKEEMKKPRVSRKKEIIKIRTEINEKETKKTIAKINKTKSWFLEKINKIDKHKPASSREKGRRINSTKLEMKKEKSQDNIEIQRVIRDYYQTLHANKMDNLEKNGQILRKV